jgi:ParB family chromosome partitioning protein
MREHFSRLFGLQEKSEREEKQEILHIPLGQIVPNRYQPRTVFDEEKISELCQTIKTHGIIQPIVVRKKDDHFEIIAGERRWRAAQRLGLDTIPAIIKDFNDAMAASAALIENLQREGLTAIEEAAAYQQIMELNNLTQESLAQRLGKGQSTIANKIRLLNLPNQVQQALLNRSITERHARALLALKDESLQLKVLEEILQKELNVKQTENRVEQLLQKDKPKQKPKRMSVPKDVRIALNTIRHSVGMVIKTGMNVETVEEDMEDFYQVTIRIPKKKA